jgi:hypothetical protein
VSVGFGDFCGLVDLFGTDPVGWGRGTGVQTFG